MTHWRFRCISQMIFAKTLCTVHSLAEHPKSIGYPDGIATCKQDTTDNTKIAEEAMEGKALHRALQKILARQKLYSGILV